MPQLAKELHDNRVTMQLPVGASMGRSSSGHFLTAPLKEYPPSMCKAIASALYSDIISTECDDSAVPAELYSRCTAMSNQLFGEHIGYD